MAGVRSLIFAWAALMALLGLTVLASFFLTGAVSLATGMTIAVAKAGLIFWFFMHLREESGLVRLFAMAAVAWLLILALLVGADYATRQPPG